MLRRAEVTDVGTPVQVRLSGDTADTSIPMIDDTIGTLSTNDTVLCGFVAGAWVILSRLEAT